MNYFYGLGDMKNISQEEINFIFHEIGTVINEDSILEPLKKNLKMFMDKYYNDVKKGDAVFKSVDTKANNPGYE